MTAIHPLRLFQVGKESTNGTAVPATEKLIGDFVFREMYERDFEEWPRGVRAPVTGGGVDVERWVEVRGEWDADYEQVLWPLQSGLETPTVAGAGPYTHTFNPDLASPVAIDSLTGEFAIDDGSTKHVEREAAYLFCTTFGVEINPGQISRMRAEWIGRASQSSTVTAALTEMTGRSVIPSSLWSVYIDSTWAGLGGTQKTLFLRSASFELNTGISKLLTADARTDLDFTGIRSGMVTGRLSLTAAVAADAATEIGNYRSGTVRFVRLTATDGTKIVTIDMAIKFTAAPDFQNEDGEEIVVLEGELEYDPTGAAAIEIEVVNQEPAL